MLETKNARIEATTLGYEDHGILTSYITLDYGGSGQGFGGYCLDRYVKSKDDRAGTAYGMEYIRRLLKTVGVSNYEDLVGKYIRVVATNTGVEKIGHITEDIWFDPKEDLKSFLEKEKQNVRSK